MTHQYHILEEEIIPFIVEQIQSNPSIRISLVIPKSGWQTTLNHKKRIITHRIQHQIEAPYKKEIIKAIETEEIDVRDNREAMTAIFREDLVRNDKQAIFREDLLIYDKQANYRFQLANPENIKDFTFWVMSNPKRLQGERFDIIISMIGQIEYAKYSLVKNGVFVDIKHE